MENTRKPREVPLILRPFRHPSLVRADAPEAWRMDWGGHDPATPQAEMLINFHSSIFPAIAAVCVHSLYLAKRFW